MDGMLVRVTRAAELLDVSRSRIYELIGSGELESVKIGGSRRVPVTAIEEFVERLRDDAPPERVVRRRVPAR